MTKSAAVDIREFARFLLVGVIATIGNLAAVYLARAFVSFECALLAGIAAGITLSFLLSKLFAFASHSWKRTGGEFVRFLIVYSVGCALYWGVAVALGRFFLAGSLSPRTAELGGAVVGAGTMALTSYLGHRFITYRTYQRTVVRVDPTS